LEAQPAQETSHPASGGKALAVLLALVTCVIWGAWFPVVRLGVLADGLTPWDMAFLRMIFPLVLLTPLVWRHGLKAGRAGWPGSFALAFTLGPPFAWVMGHGIAHAPAAHAAIGTPGVFPAIVFLLGLVFLGDAGTPRRWAGLALAVASVGLIGTTLIGSASGGGAPIGQHLTGYLLFHLCAWFWAIYIVVVRIAGLDVLRALWIGNFIGALYFLPLYLTVGESGFPAMPWRDIAWHALYQGFLNGFVAMLMFNFAIKRLGASEAAAFGALIPAIAAFTAIPILGEIPGWAEVVGALFAGAGVLLLNLPARGPKIPAPSPRLESSDC
jgi:drug/metabolite transporter (DMT)-like permease